MVRKTLKLVVMVALGAGSIVLTLALLEAGLRAGHTLRHRRERLWPGRPTLVHQISSIPGLDYEMGENRHSSLEGVPVNTNPYGMRDSEPSLQATKSHCRIAVLGDSYTFGVRVREEDTYSKVLEKLLRQSVAAFQCQFEVLNFGVIGYSTYDEDLMLKYRAVNFEPHVVILGYVLNDPECDPIQPLHAYFVDYPWWQPYRLRTLFAQVKADWDRKRLGGGDYYTYLHAEGHRKWQSVVDAFTDIRSVTSPRNIRVLVVIFPMVTTSFKGKPWTEYPYVKIHQQVSDLAAGNGFQVLDLLNAFSTYPSQTLVWPKADDHPNALGHEVAARAIENKLLEKSSYFFDLNSEHISNSSR